jgi:hypothetical protein
MNELDTIPIHSSFLPFFFLLFFFEVSFFRNFFMVTGYSDRDYSERVLLLFRGQGFLTPPWENSHYIESLLQNSKYV